MKGTKEKEKEAVLVAGCYAAEVVIVDQYNSTVRSTHTVEEIVVV